MWSAGGAAGGAASGSQETPDGIAVDLAGDGPEHRRSAEGRGGAEGLVVDQQVCAVTGPPEEGRDETSGRGVSGAGGVAGHTRDGGDLEHSREGVRGDALGTA